MISQNGRGTTRRLRLATVEALSLSRAAPLAPLVAQLRPRSGILAPPCLAVHCATGSACRLAPPPHTAPVPNRERCPPTRSDGRVPPDAPVIRAARATPKTNRTHGHESSRRVDGRSAGFPTTFYNC